jgi:hypothetical protein
MDETGWTIWVKWREIFRNRSYRRNQTYAKINEHIVKDKISMLGGIRRHCWHRDVIADTLTSLLTPGRHSWYRDVIDDVVTSLLTPWRHCRRSDVNADTVTSLLTQWHHCWYRDATKKDKANKIKFNVLQCINYFVNAQNEIFPYYVGVILSTDMNATLNTLSNDRKS